MNGRPGFPEILRNRRWMRIADPFPHYVATDVFKPAVHFAVERAVRDVTLRGLSERPVRDRLSRSMPGYDAYGYNPYDGGMPEGLQLFFSRPWHDMLATVAGVPATGYVQGGLHYHAVGSASGFVHNDFTVGWFADVPPIHGLVPSRNDLCDYKSGKRRNADVAAFPMVRVASMIYFAGNGTWSDEDGGVTGLYRDNTDRVEEPAAIIPPMSNSLLLFEITPFSFHSFITNRTTTRSSVILFLHTGRKTAVARWGKEHLARWEEH